MYRTRTLSISSTRRAPLTLPCHTASSSPQDTENKTFACQQSRGGHERTNFFVQESNNRTVSPAALPYKTPPIYAVTQQNSLTKLEVNSRNSISNAENGATSRKRLHQNVFKSAQKSSQEPSFTPRSSLVDSTHICHDPALAYPARTTTNVSMLTQIVNLWPEQYLLPYQVRGDRSHMLSCHSGPDDILTPNNNYLSSGSVYRCTSRRNYVRLSWLQCRRLCSCLEPLGFCSSVGISTGTRVGSENAR